MADVFLNATLSRQLQDRSNRDILIQTQEICPLWIGCLFIMIKELPLMPSIKLCTTMPVIHHKCSFFPHIATAPRNPRLRHCRGFMTTIRHTALRRTPVGVWSAWRRELYLTTPHIHKRGTSMSPTGFELTIPQSEQLQSTPHIARPLGSATSNC